MERRVIKAAIIVITLGYFSLLVYQGGVVTPHFQVRSVQVSDISIEPVTKFVAGVDNSLQNKNITLDDIFISVKTTKLYQNTRLPIILKTWFQLAKEQIWFFTDTDNQRLQNLTNGHMINTNCSASHKLQALCCKTSVEYDYYINSGKKWFCHFDDDNYVNVPRLVEVLQKYDYQKDVYLGRTSVYKPVKILNKATKKFNSFWFATFGAGFCISRSLALKMLPVVGGGKFLRVCQTIWYPDDITMGYVIEHLMKVNLTVLPEFHSHLEPMKLLAPETFRDQISFGYAHSKNVWNVLNVPGFDLNYDPTRFLSLHCFLFPRSEYCPKYYVF